MSELFPWIMNLANSKIVGLLIFFFTFVGIIIYVYGSRKRSERLESYRNIPFMDDDDSPAQTGAKADQENSGK